VARLPALVLVALVATTLTGCADDHLAEIEACVEHAAVDPEQINWDASSVTTMPSGSYDVRVVTAGSTDVVAECVVTQTADGLTVSG
jgi:hypothetical protein